MDKIFYIWSEFDDGNHHHLDFIVKAKDVMHAILTITKGKAMTEWSIDEDGNRLKERELTTYGKEILVHDKIFNIFDGA